MLFNLFINELYKTLQLMTIKLLKWSVFFSRYQMLVTVNLNRKKQLFPNLQESINLLFIHEAQAMWIDVMYLLFFYFFLLGRFQTLTAPPPSKYLTWSTDSRSTHASNIHSFVVFVFLLVLCFVFLCFCSFVVFVYLDLNAWLLPSSITIV